MPAPICEEINTAVRSLLSRKPTGFHESADGSLLVTLHDLTEYQVGELAVWAWGSVKILSPDALRQEIIDFGNILLKNQY